MSSRTELEAHPLSAVANNNCPVSPKFQYFPRTSPSGDQAFKHEIEGDTSHSNNYSHGSMRFYQLTILHLISNEAVLAQTGSQSKIALQYKVQLGFEPREYVFRFLSKSRTQLLPVFYICLYAGMYTQHLFCFFHYNQFFSLITVSSPPTPPTSHPHPVPSKSITL